MKAEITIDVNANITVSDETAKICLSLLSIWQKNNQDKVVRFKDGYFGFDTVTFVSDGKIEEDVFAKYNGKRQSVI